MHTETMLMKIESARFGIGGYQDAMLGLHLSFKTQSSGVGTSECFWSPSLISHTERCRWTEAERDAKFAQICRLVDKLLYDAKVSSVDKLVGIPVEVVCENRTFKSFRILTEVL